MRGRKALELNVTAAASQWHIDLQDFQKRYSLPLRKIKSAARCVFQEEKVKTAQLSVVFVTDSAIRTMNRRFLGRDRPTDVLAFDMSDAGLSYKKNKARHLEGEVAISLMTAARNAKRFGNSLQEEAVLYVIHGVLHLLGYDDHAEADTARMRRREQELLEICETRGFCAP